MRHREVKNWAQHSTAGRSSSAEVGPQRFGCRAHTINRSARLPVRSIHSAASMRTLFCTALYIVVVILIFCNFCLVRNVTFISFLIWYELRNVRASFQSCIRYTKNLNFHHLNSQIDVAIGAPQEDDLRGAIYIYNGRADGISPAFSQVRDNSIFKDNMAIKASLKLPVLMWTYFS